jgi:hypothetical protein
MENGANIQGLNCDALPPLSCNRQCRTSKRSSQSLQPKQPQHNHPILKTMQQTPKVWLKEERLIINQHDQTTHLARGHLLLTAPALSACCHHQWAAYCAAWHTPPDPYQTFNCNCS